MNKIRFCPSCNIYTLKDICVCGIKSKTKTPPRYSSQDKLAKYRRQIKKDILKTKGLL